MALLYDFNASFVVWDLPNVCSLLEIHEVD